MTDAERKLWQCLRAGQLEGLKFLRARTEYLQRQGLDVIRFWDNEVLLNIESVVDAIWSRVAHRTLTPTPLPEGEGL